MSFILVLTSTIAAFIYHNTDVSKLSNGVKFHKFLLKFIISTHSHLRSIPISYKETPYFTNAIAFKQFLTFEPSWVITQDIQIK